jgi:hypothetical protein
MRSGMFRSNFDKTESSYAPNKVFIKAMIFDLKAQKDFDILY